MEHDRCIGWLDLSLQMKDDIFLSYVDDLVGDGGTFSSCVVLVVTLEITPSLSPSLSSKMGFL